MIEANGLFIGVDIGKTKISSGIINIKKLTILDSLYEEYSVKTKECILSIVENHICHYIKSFHVEGIGIASFGLIDKKNEFVISSKSISEWNNVHLAKYCREKFGIENTFVFNDVTAACVGEYFKLGNVNSLCYISVGTSIGVSAIIKGKILEGEHNLSGQIAHIEIANGQTFSDLCGGNGIERQYSLLTGNFRRVKEIFEQSKNNDVIAKLVRDKAVENLVLLANMTCLMIDPEVLVFGGGVIKDKEFRNDTIELLEQRIIDSLKVKQSPYSVWSSCGIYDVAILGGAILCHLHVK